MWSARPLASVLLAAAVASASCGEAATPADQQARRGLGAYNFCIEERPVAVQAELLDALGYTDVTLWYTLPEVLDEWVAQPAVSAGRLRLATVLYQVDAADLDRVGLEVALRAMARAQALPWLLVGNSAPVDRNQVVGVVREVADLAAKLDRENGGLVVLYPHAGQHIDTAEVALEVLQQAGRDNLMLSLHLCHEL